jgi:hypothetical protein
VGTDSTIDCFGGGFTTIWVVVVTGCCGVGTGAGGGIGADPGPRIIIAADGGGGGAAAIGAAIIIGAGGGAENDIIA